MSEVSGWSTERLRAELEARQNEIERPERANDEAYQEGTDSTTGPYEGNYRRMDRLDEEIREIVAELDRR